MRLYIEKQNYPDFRGERPTSYAIWLKRAWWRRREFVGYCWQRERADTIVQYLEEVYQ